MNDGILEEATRAVCKLVPSTEKLRVLQFHNNMTGDEGAVAISKILRHCPSLDDFRCSYTQVGSEGGVALFEALGENLKKLDLRENMFGVEVGVKLSKALSKHEYLIEVYLSYLNLEDEGAIAIANALKEAAPLLGILEIAGNDITAEAACISAKKAITKLNLSENELKDEGVIRISNALEAQDQVKDIDMSVNSLRSARARSLAQALVHKAEFKLLNVNENFISDEGIDELKDIFKESLKNLGPMDENDPEGGDDDNNRESRDDGEGSEDELESKLKNLDANQDE